MRLWPFRRKTEQRSISFQDLWGSGADVSTIRGDSINTALTLAPVFAATRLIADSIAALPLQAYRKTGEERQAIPTPSLLSDPSMFGGRYEWVQRALISLLLRGNAYGLVTSVDANGWPRQIEWLHPDDVTLRDNQTNARPQWYWQGRRVDPWLGRDSVGQLLHIPWYAIPGQILGLSPIRAFSTTIEQGILAGRFGRDFFADDGIPSAVLETEQQVDEVQAKIIKQRFLASARGRQPVVMGAGTVYKPIAVNPEESQFLETIKATATQIASIYGVPPEMIGGESGNSMTYANVEQQSLNLVTHTLRPYLTKLEQHFSLLLPRPQYARFNLDALLRADLKTRYDSYAVGINARFLHPDEVRELEDRPPLTAEQQADLAPKARKPQLPPAKPEEEDERGRVIPLPRAINE